VVLHYEGVSDDSGNLGFDGFDCASILQSHRGANRGDLDVRFARKNSPEMLRASQRTTTIF
jgi:hypothetical protein